MHIALGKKSKKKNRFLKETSLNLKAENKVVVVDLKCDIFPEGNGLELNLDNLNPFLSPLSYKDINAINAGVAEYQTFMSKVASEILKETDVDFDPVELKRKHLLRDVIDRSLSSWDDYVNENMKSSMEFFNFNNYNQNVKVEDYIDLCKNEDLIILRSENLRLTEARMLIFLLLNRFKESFGTFGIVSGDSNIIWKDGYLKSLFRELSLNESNVYFSFNKSEKIPKILKEKTTTYHLFEKINEDVFGDIKIKDHYSIEKNSRTNILDIHSKNII